MTYRIKGRRDHSAAPTTIATVPTLKAASLVMVAAIAAGWLDVRMVRLRPRKATATERRDGVHVTLQPGDVVVLPGGEHCWVCMCRGECALNVLDEDCPYCHATRPAGCAP